MKTVWKVLGAAALAAALTPYRVTADQDTGDIKLRALLWKATYGRRPGNQGLNLDFGFFAPNEEEEPHLYADELVVHYHNGQPCTADDPAWDDEPCCEPCACKDDCPYGQGDAGAPAPEEAPDASPEAREEAPAPGEAAPEDGGQHRDA